MLCKSNWWSKDKNCSSCALSFSPTYTQSGAADIGVNTFIVAPKCPPLSQCYKLPGSEYINYAQKKTQATIRCVDYYSLLRNFSIRRTSFTIVERTMSTRKVILTAFLRMCNVVSQHLTKSVAAVLQDAAVTCRLERGTSQDSDCNQLPGSGTGHIKTRLRQVL